MFGQYLMNNNKSIVETISFLWLIKFGPDGIPNCKLKGYVAHKMWNETPEQIEALNMIKLATLDYNYKQSMFYIQHVLVFKRVINFKSLNWKKIEMS